MARVLKKYDWSPRIKTFVPLRTWNDVFVLVFSPDFSGQFYLLLTSHEKACESVGWLDVSDDTFVQTYLLLQQDPVNRTSCLLTAAQEFVEPLMTDSDRVMEGVIRCIT